MTEQEATLQTLWGETKPRRPRRRRKRNRATRTSTLSYSITGSNDCEIIGHTEGHRDLAGCTVCLDCGVSIYCPVCLPEHPHDRNAIPLFCPQHDKESQVKYDV